MFSPPINLHSHHSQEVKRSVENRGRSPRFSTLPSPTHSTVVYNLHVHIHADIPNVDTEWSKDPQLNTSLQTLSVTQEV